MLKNISIKSKFILMVAITILGISSEILIAWQGETSIISLNVLESTEEKTASSILLLRRHEKDFQLRNDAKSIEAWKSERQHLQELIGKLETQTRKSGISSEAAIASLSEATGAYGKAFLALADMQTKAGLTPETGLQGDLRNAVHAAEKSLDQLNDDHLLKNMLMLRRHEKDFLLRQDEIYVAKFEKAFTVMMDSKLDPAVATQMETYHSAFLQMVQAYREIGLTPDAGLSGQMRQAVHKTDEAMAILDKDVQDAIGQAQTRQHILGAVTGVFVSLIAVLISVLIAREVVNPIHRLAGTTNSLASGVTDLVVEGIDRKDEISLLAKALEQWRTSLIERELRRTEELEEQRKREVRQARIEQATQQFDSVILTMLGNIRNAVEHLHGSANDLSANAEQTQRQSQAVSAATEQATANVESVSAASSELAASISEISRQVTQSTSTSQAATEEAAEAGKKIFGLQTSAQKIGEVVSLINDIAAQTNLLALNATIEAARAGDAGKGFAVVANEVKHLAAQTGKATGDIANQVSSVQEETKATVQAIENIARTISEIAGLSTAIAGAVEEQGAATSEIAQSVHQASQGTRVVADNISEVARTAARTGEMAQSLYQAANELMQESQTLEQAVTSFLQDVRSA